MAHIQDAESRSVEEQPRHTDALLLPKAQRILPGLDRVPPTLTLHQEPNANHVQHLLHSILHIRRPLRLGEADRVCNPIVSRLA